jgi:flagellar hook assembly protein FlgD
MDSLSATASDIQADYMKLLVTQLQNQNPLEPLDNNEMASQLAQFSQLEQLETMNNSFERALNYIERNYAASLLGKNISFLKETETGTVDTAKGTVEQIYNSSNGEITLVVGDNTIRLADILSVEN